MGANYDRGSISDAANIGDSYQRGAFFSRLFGRYPVSPIFAADTKNIFFLTMEIRLPGVMDFVLAVARQKGEFTPPPQRVKMKRPSKLCGL